MFAISACGAASLSSRAAARPFRRVGLQGARLSHAESTNTDDLK
jgi:hypothetical protein